MNIESVAIKNSELCMCEDSKYVPNYTPIILRSRISLPKSSWKHSGVNCDLLSDIIMAYIIIISCHRVLNFELPSKLTVC